MTPKTRLAFTLSELERIELALTLAAAESRRKCTVSLDANNLPGAKAHRENELAYLEIVTRVQNAQLSTKDTPNDREQQTTPESKRTTRPAGDATKAG